MTSGWLARVACRRFAASHGCPPRDWTGRALHNRARNRRGRHGDRLSRARPQEQRNVALKVLNPELGAILGAGRFLAEIQVTANLQHPNLLPLLDSGEVEGLLFYTMPFIDGESLRARLDREKQLTVDEAIRISSTIAGALDYAHRQHVIHRDLKPENILMHEGQPLIADFGIALAVSNGGGARVTQTGLSLGMPRNRRPTVPPHADAAVACALEKLAADRFSTAGEFARALDGRAPMATRSHDEPAARRSATGRSKAREIAAWSLAGLLLLLLGWQQLNRRAVTADAPVVRMTFDLPLGTRINDVLPGTTIAVAQAGDLIAYTVTAGASYKTIVVHNWHREMREKTSRRN